MVTIDLPVVVDVNSYLDCLKELGWDDDVVDIQEITELVTEYEMAESERNPSKSTRDEDPYYNVPPPSVDAELHKNDSATHALCVEWVEKHARHKWAGFKKHLNERWPVACFLVCLEARNNGELRIEVSLGKVQNWYDARDGKAADLKGFFH